MAVILKSKNVTPTNTSRTELYLCPASGVLDTTVFSGTITNVDTAGMGTHSVTVERQLTNDGAYVLKLVRIPIAFGGSLKFPKMALEPGEKVWITSHTASMITVDVSLAERT